VVEVPGHHAREHARHTRGTPPAGEQVHAERGVALPGEPVTDVTDVLVEAERLMDDHHAGVRPGAVGKR